MQYVEIQIVNITSSTWEKNNSAKKTARFINEQNLNFPRKKQRV